MATRIKSLVGKEYEHEHYGKVLVTGVPKGSRKFVEVKCIQRKPGWHEQNKRYEKVKRVVPNPDGGNTIYWDTHRTDEYGVEDTVHIDTLKI